jgi:hypothetical protein|tara:strand:+ start:18419 stop:19108 length:690 start_codon:yes stop_codon:yes gene_type:complete
MKEYKYLVVNGCSFMVGTGCDNVLQNRASKLLSDRLKCEEINLSKNGGSNDRIFRTTYDWIQNNPHKVNQSLFIIGLTDLYRKDLYSNTNEKYVHGSELYSKSPKHYADAIGCGSNELSEYAEFNLKYITSEFPLKDNLNRQCDLLNTYIKSQGGRLIIFQSLFGKVGKKNNLWLNKTGNLFHKEHFKPGGFDSWRDFMVNSNRNYDGGHPSSKDNKVLAQQLYKYIYE